jgi:formylglycine-generating enzyme required for sulfatase activity
MNLIPAGEFLKGSDPQEDEAAQNNEQPQHLLWLPDYYLAKTPVTNAQYRAFVLATSREKPDH